MKSMVNPLVSISCITYNHASYIRQCLDGFMMQQTNFAFEVLIHDDASTDGTTEIIKEYEAKYPDIIKPIYEEENQWVKGRRGSAVFNFPRAKGKYIAMCEGDDYWTNPHKLQEQVDFLEDHPEFVLCCHGFAEISENDESVFQVWTPKQNRIITLQNFIDGECCITTLTVMFRQSTLLYSNYNIYKSKMDLALFYSLLSLGLGCYAPNVMAVYRKHKGGIWSSINTLKQWAMSFYVKLRILEIEKDRNAAIYMYKFLMIKGSRRVIFSYFKDICKALYYICRYLDLRYAINVVFFSIFRKSCFTI